MRHLPCRAQRKTVNSVLVLLSISLVVAGVGSKRASAQQANSRTMTVDDLLRVAGLGNVLISPDGRQVFYSISDLDWDENKRRTRYFMVPFSGGEPRPYVGDAGGRSFLFSPDVSLLTFLRKLDEEEQVFGLPTSGGEARQLTRHKGGIAGYRWEPEGSAIFFSAAETRGDEEQREHDLGLDPVFVDEAPNGKHAARFRNLWVHDTATDKASRLTDEELIIGAFDVSPDGQRVSLSARRDTRTNTPFLSELYLYERGSGKLTRLTQNRASESNPLWAPDGKSFLYRAPSDVEPDLRNGYFWVMDVASGQSRRLDAQNQGRVSNVAWTRDGRGILFNETRGADTNLYRLDVASDQVSPLTRRPGQMQALAYSADRERVVFSYQNFTTPADLWAEDHPLQELVEPRRGKAAVGPDLNLKFLANFSSNGFHDSFQNRNDVRGSPLVSRPQYDSDQVPRNGIEDQQRMQNVVSVIAVVKREFLLAVSVVVSTVQVQDDRVGASLLQRADITL